MLYFIFVNNLKSCSKVIFCLSKYYFGVVKADCYGHNGISAVKTIIGAGCNYLAVATLDEALIIRKEILNNYIVSNIYFIIK